jgi:hypothetical protein
MRIARLIGCLSLAAALGGCWGTVTENPAAEYVRRTDTIVPDAGEAMKVNAATHVIDPWPRYVGDRRIPVDGERMVTAVQRHHRPPAQQGRGGGAALVQSTTSESTSSQAGGTTQGASASQTTTTLQGQ